MAKAGSLKALGSIRWVILILLYAVQVPFPLLAGDYSYESAPEESGIMITAYSGPGGDITIPSTILDQPVTAVAGNAFYFNTKVTGVVFPDSVHHIYGAIFQSCTSLKNAVLPKGLTAIYGFNNCGSLTNVVLPDSLIYIGWTAFAHCTNLPTVAIPKNVASIDEWAFSNCPSLTAFVVEPDNPNFSARDGVLFNKDQTKLLHYPNGRSGRYAAPATVKEIAESAFVGSVSLSSVTLPEGLTYLGLYAFYNCSGLAEVSLPNSLAEIRENAFEQCRALRSVKFPTGLTFIGNQAFDYCASLTNVAFPDALVAIGDSAFRGCSNLTDVKLPKSLLNIGAAAFGGCSGLSKLDLPPGLVELRSYTFEACAGLTNVVLPEALTTLWDAAFRSCPSLRSIAIPIGVTNIMNSVFDNCPGLVSVYFAGDAPRYENKIFEGDPNVVVYRLPEARGWSSTFAGRPVVIWNPTAPKSDPQFGIQAGKFGFTVTGNDGLQILVEATSDLTSPIWVPIQTLTLPGGSSYFTDPDQPLQTRRFYRFRSP